MLTHWTSHTICQSCETTVLALFCWYVWTCLSFMLLCSVFYVLLLCVYCVYSVFFCCLVRINKWMNEWIAISAIISKVFEYCFWTDLGHYFLRRIISLVLKKTPVVGMRYTLFVRSSTAMLFEVQLPTSGAILSVESNQNVESKTKNVESKTEKCGVQDSIWSVDSQENR